MKEESIIIQQDKLNENKKIVLYFFIYAFLGWVLETVFCLVTQAKFMKRGFLYGPVCPMYGFAAVIMIQLLKNVKTNTVGKFSICMITFTIFEYVVAVVLESLFGLRWWDYSNEVLNFQGRISLPYSIAWGIVGIIFVDKIHPAVQRRIEKIEKLVSSKIIVITLYSLTSVILVDFIASIIKYMNL